MLNNKELVFFKYMFLLAALWNLIGAGFGYFKEGKVQGKAGKVPESNCFELDWDANK